MMLCTLTLASITLSIFFLVHEYEFLVRFKQPVMNVVFNKRFKRFNNLSECEKKVSGFPIRALAPLENIFNYLCLNFKMLVSTG